MNDCGMPMLIERPLVYQSTTPPSTEATPRVTMREFTPTRATVLPLLRPMRAPMAMAAAMAAQTGQPFLTMNPAASIWQSPAADPTEKSNSPHTSGIMMARARMPITAWLPRTFEMFAEMRKLAPVFDHVLKKMNVTANSAGSAYFSVYSRARALAADSWGCSSVSASGG